MENVGVKRLGIIGSACKGAGTCVGTVAFAGKKITGFMGGSLAAVGHLLTRPIEPSEFDTDEHIESTPETSVIKPNSKKTTVSQNALKDRVTTLKSELAAAHNQLAHAQNKVKNAQSQFVLQLQAQQVENKSLISDLEQAVRQTEQATAQVSAAKTRVAALESELAEARRQLEEAKSQAQQAQERLTLQLENLQKERDSLLCELEHARNEVNETKARQDAAGTHVARLESELVAAKSELDQARKFEKDVKPDEGQNVIVEEYLSEPRVSESDIPILEDVEAIEIQQVELSEQWKEPVIEQTGQEVEPSTETTAVQSDEPERVETEAMKSGPVIAETSSSVPADVTIEEVNVADFENATEKIIFNNALSGISSPDKATRLDAVKVMAGIGHELSARVLIGQMAKEPVAQIRAECIKALAELNMKEGLPAIENALSEQDVSVRSAAVRGLYRLGGAASAPQLLRMLCDENENIRRRTATCIGWLGKEELAVELVPLLDDSSVSVRLAAVEAMGHLRNRQVVSDLITHLEYPEKTVRKAIISALETITSKKMSGSFPRDEKSLKILIVRWAEWWKDEHKVLCQI